MWLYYFAKAICMIAFNIWYKLDYHGLENIPSGGGYILMSNHRSMIDPIILAEKAHGQVRYMGKMELFRNPILGWALRTIGTFPVDRGAGDTSAIDNSRKVIEEGDILGIFPEGHRSKTGEPLRPKSGVALGAGEILLTSVDNEGLQQGMDLELIEAVTKAVNVPVICGGGVGCGDDIVDAANAGADAVACAAVLHYKKETVTELKEDIRAGGVEVRQV